MSKPKLKCYNILQVEYSDGSLDKVSVESKLCWARFKWLSKYFINNPWCGIKQISIFADYTSIKPIINVQNFCV